MPKGSLIVVGTGIQSLRHLTSETIYEIENADKLLYLIADNVTETWLQELNPKAESLAKGYKEGYSRQITYDQWVLTILDYVRSGSRVCVAFYGHPGVFVFSGHEAVRIAVEEGYSARMMPAISAEDCLFADLGVDPSYGCQSYEATSFVVSERKIDVCSSLILWQIAMLGQVDYRKQFSLKAIPFLIEILEKYYPSEHIVTVYEAAIYPICQPRIEKVLLSALDQVKITSGSTLYVPPLYKPEVNKELAARLKAMIS